MAIFVTDQPTFSGKSQTKEKCKGHQYLTLSLEQSAHR